MDSCALKNSSIAVSVSSLKNWFLDRARDLPWRTTKDPYAIWVSEVMLQQTQVVVVVPYFHRWMKRFPTIESLAKADLDQVIKLWEGLGYYSRARNLHEGARFIVANFEGKLPANASDLHRIKGLGPYTVAAILSFAFHQKIAVVDGNVSRVMARWRGIKEDITKLATMQAMRQYLNEILPEEQHWIVSEAFIELGATVCQRKANCIECPLKASCVSFRDGLTELLPVKSKAAKTEHLFRFVALLQNEEFYLVSRGKKGEVMSDLYQFPYFETSKEQIEPAFLEKILTAHLKGIWALKEPLKPIKHGFTKYQCWLYPFTVLVDEQLEMAGFEWVHKDTLRELPFSSGHRRVLDQMT